MDVFSLDSTFANLEGLDEDDTSISQENLAALANLNTQETYTPQPPINGLNTSPDKILNKINHILREYNELINQKQCNYLHMLCLIKISAFTLVHQLL